MLRTPYLVLTLLHLVLAEKGPGNAGIDEDDIFPASAAPPVNSSGTEVAVSSIPSIIPNSTSTYSETRPTITIPAPALRFSMPSNATTCTAVTFTWEVIPSSSNVTDVYVRLLITNYGVQQAPPPSESPVPTSIPLAPRQLPSIVVSRDLTNRTSLASGAFMWPVVTVPVGWYILEASPANAYRSDIASQSAQFFVTAGPNTTCVDPNVPSTAQVASSRSHLSAGALAGTVVGTVVGLAALLGAFALPRIWRRGVPEHQAWKGKAGRLYQLF